jgi:hypothetical protein
MLLFVFFLILQQIKGGGSFKQFTRRAEKAT